MSKLYQEELQRLMQSQQRGKMLGNAAAAGAGLGAPGGENKAGPGGQLPELPGLPGLFPGLTGGLFQRAQQSDLQRAMDVYHQELQRLQQNALAALRAQQNGKDENAENRPKTETPGPPESPSADTKSPGAARQESPLGNFRFCSYLVYTFKGLGPFLIYLNNGFQNQINCCFSCCEKTSLKNPITIV